MSGSSSTMRILTILVLLYRQHDRERATFTRFALNLDAAAMRLHNFVGHREADSRSLYAVNARLLTAMKLRKDRDLLPVRDADAVIPHANAHIFAVTMHRNLDLAPIGRVFRRVIQKIPNSPAERFAVGIDRNRTVSAK